MADRPASQPVFGRANLSGQPGNGPPSSGPHDEPKGIARYFQPANKTTHTQPPALSALVRSFPPLGSSTPASSSSRPGAPATPALVRTPSRIAVIINSSSSHPRHSHSHKTSQPPSRDPSPDPLQGLVTSDIRPPRRPKPTTTPTPQKPSSTTTTTPATNPRPSAHTPGTAPAPKRPRGRPLGWRPGMGSYSSAAPSSSNATAPRPAKPVPRTGPPKRRGRPPGAGKRQSARAVFEQLRPPPYVAFLCEWAGCPAEMLNAEALRRHVRVVHCRGAEEAPAVCRWGRCAEGEARFGDVGGLEAHVERAHLLPFVWHVGDGPRNTLEGAAAASGVKGEGEEERLPGYLFDEEGNQVTPSVAHQELENEEERRERRRRLRRLLFERDQNAPEEEPESEEVEGDGTGGR